MLKYKYIIVAILHGIIFTAQIILKRFLGWKKKLKWLPIVLSLILIVTLILMDLRKEILFYLGLFCIMMIDYFSPTIIFNIICLVLCFMFIIYCMVYETTSSIRAPSEHSSHHSVSHRSSESQKSTVVLDDSKRQSDSEIIPSDENPVLTGKILGKQIIFGSYPKYGAFVFTSGGEIAFTDPRYEHLRAELLAKIKEFIEQTNCDKYYLPAPNETNNQYIFWLTAEDGTKKLIRIPKNRNQPQMFRQKKYHALPIKTANISRHSAPGPPKTSTTVPMP